jgi:hypothetical protein
MDHAMSLHPRPVDSDLPEVAALLGPEAGEILAAALPDVDVETWSTTQVRYEPGRAITVQYRVVAHTAEGAHDATIVAAVGVDVPDGTSMLLSDGRAIAMWRFPDDPLLPGLGIAARPARAGELLEQIGLPAGTARLRTRAYRAGRRAVVEAVVAGSRVFLKVVRPGSVAGLQQRHEGLARSVPVPHSLGWSGEHGIVVLQAMPGNSLRRQLETTSAPLPAPAAVVQLLDRFTGPPGARGVAGAHRRAEFHARLLRAVAPGLSDRINAIVAALAEIRERAPAVPVHGDLHVAQLLVDGSTIVGIVDVDTAGIGHRANDLANMVGHLATLSTVSPAAARIDAYGAQLMAHFDRVVEPADLRRRVAGTILALATGPFRVQMEDWPRQTERRIALAERWLESADGTANH